MIRALVLLLLLALPAQVAEFDSASIVVTVDGVDVEATHRVETPGCVVADTFTAYRDIRGAICQGTVWWPPETSIYRSDGACWSGLNRRT